MTELETEDAKRLSDAIDRFSRELRNLHTDVTMVLSKVCPGAKPERAAGNWPPIKSMEDVRRAFVWLSSGVEGLQADVRRISARLDVVMNDAHAFDEMKAYLKRGPPHDRRRDD